MRVTVIHNEEAGGPEPTEQALMAAIREEGHEPRYSSSRPDDLTRALEEPGDLVAVAGGDGTVVGVASWLAGRAVPIAVVPAGTANNIAAFLGIGGTWRSALAGWSRSTPRPVDLGWVSGRGGMAPFVESVGCGLMVDLMVRFDAEQSQPEPRSPAEEVGQARDKCRELIRQSRPRNYRVELDGRDFSGPYLLVEAMNMGRLGPRLPLAPQADASDGLLDVVLIAEEDRSRLEASLDRQPLRENPAAPSLGVRRARQVLMDPGEDLLHVGGEPWPTHGPAGPVRVYLQERALLFLAPTTSPFLSMSV